MAQTGTRDNFSGNLELTAPTGGVTKGLIYLISNTYVVALETASAAATFLAAVVGPVYATKPVATGDTFAKGQNVYAASNKADPNVATTGDEPIGIALEAVTAADTEVLIYLGIVNPTVA